MSASGTGASTARTAVVETGSGAGAAGTTTESNTKGDTTIVTQKIVEASKIVSPTFQGVGRMREFVCDLIRNCETAGGRTDGLEGVWLRQLLKKWPKFEDFGVSLRLTIEHV